MILSAAALLAGVVMLIEFTWHRTLDMAQGSFARVAGFSFDTGQAPAWTLALVCVAVGGASFEYMRRHFKAEWDRIQEEIEDWLRDNPEER